MRAAKPSSAPYLARITPHPHPTPAPPPSQPHVPHGALLRPHRGGHAPLRPPAHGALLRCGSDAAEPARVQCARGGAAGGVRPHGHGEHGRVLGACLYLYVLGAGGDATPLPAPQVGLYPTPTCMHPTGPSPRQVRCGEGPEAPLQPWLCAALCGCTLPGCGHACSGRCGQCVPGRVLRGLERLKATMGGCPGLGPAGGGVGRGAGIWPLCPTTVGASVRLLPCAGRVLLSVRQYGCRAVCLLAARRR